MEVQTIFLAKVAITLALIWATVMTRGDKAFFFGLMAFVSLCSIF